MRRALVGSTLLALIGIAALEAQPPTPTRTPKAVRPSPTASKGASQGEAAPAGGSTARAGSGSSPVRSDSTALPAAQDKSPSQILSETAAQYDEIESAIESSFKKLTADQKDGIDELEAQIAAIDEQIQKLKEMQEKLKKMEGAVQEFNK